MKCSGGFIPPIFSSPAHVGAGLARTAGASRISCSPRIRLSGARLLPATCAFLHSGRALLQLICQRRAIRAGDSPFVPDRSITMTSDGSVGGEEIVRAHG